MISLNAEDLLRKHLFDFFHGVLGVLWLFVVEGISCIDLQLNSIGLVGVFVCSLGCKHSSLSHMLQHLLFGAITDRIEHLGPEAFTSCHAEVWIEA